jgi:hypothetical protein
MKKSITIDDLLNVSKMLDEQKETIEFSQKTVLIDLCNKLGEQEMGKSIEEKGLPKVIMLPTSTPDYFFAGLKSISSCVRVERIHHIERIIFSWIDPTIQTDFQIEPKLSIEHLPIFSFY